MISEFHLQALRLITTTPATAAVLRWSNSYDIDPSTPAGGGPRRRPRHTPTPAPLRGQVALQIWTPFGIRYLVLFSIDRKAIYCRRLCRWWEHSRKAGVFLEAVLLLPFPMVGWRFKWIFPRLILIGKSWLVFETSLSGFFSLYLSVCLFVPVCLSVPSISVNVMMTFFSKSIFQDIYLTRYKYLPLLTLLLLVQYPSLGKPLSHFPSLATVFPLGMHIECQFM